MGTMSSIAIELEGVGRILLNRNLAVPIYQRSYAWEDEHVRDLLTDFETAMSEGAHEYFIGSIVTTKNQALRAEVADGQQRLATVTIILSAIRMKNKIGVESFHSPNQRGVMIGAGDLL